jgi:hypothetical protein
MPTLVGPSPGTGARVTTADSGFISRLLVTVYARERLEEAIRAVAEDALSPSRPDLMPWHGEAAFDDEVGQAVRDIAASANGQLIERLTALLESAPPNVVDRMASGPRWPEQG